MTRLLLSETAFHRIQPRLGALGGRIECVVMEKTGTIRLDGRELSPKDANPKCALISNDIFFASIETSYLDALTTSAALEWVQSAGAGLDHPMFLKLAERGIHLTTNHGQAIGMAEYVMWGVLNHFQNGSAIAADQAAHRWSKRRAREVAGTRWLIIGFGAIGEAVARLAKGFGSHVTGIRRRAEPSPFADEIATPNRLFEFLCEADVVVLCVPQTRATTNMVNADFLAAMKPGSMLVNVGRGSVIDDGALFTALDTGKPEHALLDVFRTEPLPAQSRFWDHPRITVTAHTSALSSRAEARADELFVENLARYLAGQTLLHEAPASEVIAASVIANPGR